MCCKRELHTIRKGTMVEISILWFTDGHDILIEHCCSRNVLQRDKKKCRGPKIISKGQKNYLVENDNHQIRIFILQNMRGRITKEPHPYFYRVRNGPWTIEKRPLRATTYTFCNRKTPRWQKKHLSCERSKKIPWSMGEGCQTSNRGQ